MNYRPIVCEHMELERAGNEAALLRRIARLEEKLARLEEVLRIDLVQNLTVQASNIEIQAANINADVPVARFSGVLQCDTIIANSVVGSSYTPGAGNVM